MGLSLDELHYGQLGAFETVGSDIRGQHAPRTIHQENYVLTQQLTGLGLLSPLRASQRESDSRRRHHQERILHGTPPRAARSRKSVDNFRGSQFGETSPARPRRIPLQNKQSHRRQDGEPEPARFGEMGVSQVHGTRRKRVLTSSISNPNKPVAASSGHWKRGR